MRAGRQGVGSLHPILAKEPLHHHVLSGLEGRQGVPLALERRQGHFDDVLRGIGQRFTADRAPLVRTRQGGNARRTAAAHGTGASTLHERLARGGPGRLGLAQHPAGRSRAGAKNFLVISQGIAFQEPQRASTLEKGPLPGRHRRPIQEGRKGIGRREAFVEKGQGHQGLAIKFQSRTHPVGIKAPDFRSFSSATPGHQSRGPKPPGHEHLISIRQLVKVGQRRRPLKLAAITHHKAPERQSIGPLKGRQHGSKGLRPAEAREEGSPLYTQYGNGALGPGADLGRAQPIPREGAKARALGKGQGEPGPGGQGLIKAHAPALKQVERIIISPGSEYKLPRLEMPRRPKGLLRHPEGLPKGTELPEHGANLLGPEGPKRLSHAVKSR